MENQAQEQIIQQQAIKCPRCHSSHTKFCYYNNYSLSQPRYLCKACKRYWTRGGTLRNVPVGGGCRKNKKVKKAAVAKASIDCTSPSLSAPVTTTSTNPSSSQFRTDSFNSLFYGLNSNIWSSDIVNISFQRNNFSVDTDPVYGYNLQKNLLGFSSKSFLSDYVTTTPIFGSSYNLGVSPSQTMAMGSLISAYSNHEPDKSITHGNNLFGITSNYDADMQMQGVNKLNQVEANSNDQNSLLSVGANWFDPSNFGSSVPCLI